MSQFRLPTISAEDTPQAPATPLLRLATAPTEVPPAEPEATHLLHFEPLASQGAGLDIPCDPQGCVGLDALGDKLRNDYFFARALIGCLFARPTVRLAMPLMHA